MAPGFHFNDPPPLHLAFYPMTFLGFLSSVSLWLHAADAHLMHACIQINNACLLTSMKAISDKILYVPSVFLSPQSTDSLLPMFACQLLHEHHLFSGKMVATPVVKLKDL